MHTAYARFIALGVWDFMVIDIYKRLSASVVTFLGIVWCV